MLKWVTTSKVSMFGHARRATNTDLQVESKYVKFLEKLGRAVLYPLPSKAATPTAGVATSTTQPLSWVAGDHTPTDYTIQYKTHAGTTWSTFAHAASNATSRTVTGLTADTSYDYRIATVNKQGAGPVSDTRTASTAP